MGLQDVIALSVAGAAALFAGRTIWRSINRGGCGGSCGRANKAASQGTPPPSPRLVRTPLVSIDQIGVPSKYDDSN
jgi:hypothetical protein